MTQSQHSRSVVRTLLVVAILLASIVVTFLGVRISQELRRKAAVPGGSASIFLTPSSTTLTQGTNAVVTLTGSIQSSVVDGFQVVADVTGTIPQDFSFDPVVPTGLRLVMSTLDTSDAGRTFRLAYTTQDPLTPFTMNGFVTLGTFAWTVPASGALTISFNQELTKIVQTQTTNDIVSIPASETYVFELPPTPTPTSTPTSTPTPSPTPTNIPTPTVTPTPTSTPQPNAIPVISTKSLSGARNGKPYTAKISGYDTNRTDTLTLQVVGLPPGVTQKTCVTEQGSSRVTISCTISGTPSTAGTFSVAATLTDNRGGVAKRTYNLLVK